MVLYHAGDMAGTIMQQHKELIINERCLGLDHLDTAQRHALLFFFFCFNALRCLDSIYQFVMFDDINSLNVVIYLSKKKKKKKHTHTQLQTWLFQLPQVTISNISQ